MIQLSDQSTDSKIDTSELDELREKDPRRLRLQLALGKETADRVLRDEARKEREAAAAWAKMSSAEKILSLLHGKIEDDLLARIEKILKG
ncbi:MAG TPA: hypothetical protein VM658_07035 [bacterium]|nr:hypothetical protein [bacterium]